VKVVLDLEHAGYVEEMVKSIICHLVTNGVLLVKAQADVIRVGVQVRMSVKNVEVQEF